MNLKLKKGHFSYIYKYIRTSYYLYSKEYIQRVFSPFCCLFARFVLVPRKKWYKLKTYVVEYLSCIYSLFTLITVDNNFFYICSKFYSIFVFCQFFQDILHHAHYSVGLGYNFLINDCRIDVSFFLSFSVYFFPIHYEFFVEMFFIYSYATINFSLPSAEFIRIDDYLHRIFYQFDFFIIYFSFIKFQQIKKCKKFRISQSLGIYSVLSCIDVKRICFN